MAEPILFSPTAFEGAEAARARQSGILWLMHEGSRG
jgi:hypothetical protein